MFILVIVMTLADFGHNFFVITPNDTVAMLGDTTQLNCTYDVKGLAAWYKGVFGKGQEAITLGNKTVRSESQYEIVGDKENLKYNLRIRNVTMNNEDNYECGDQDYINKRAKAHLYVIEKLPICTVETSNILKAGERATLECSIDLNENAPGELVWFKNGSEIYREEVQQSLVTVQTEKSDNGAPYDCEFQHFTLPWRKWSETRCKEPVIIDVQYLSKVGMTVTPTHNVRESEDVFIVCETFNGNPGPYNITIFRDEEIIISNNASEVHYEMSNISRSESGVYKCEAFTKFYDGSEDCSSEEKKIVVNYPAALNKPLQTTFQAKIDDVVGLVCKANGFPAPKIHWFNGRSGIIPGDEENRKITTIFTNETTTTSTLTVIILDKSYYGNYTCEASNGILPSPNQTMDIIHTDELTASKSTFKVVSAIIVIVVIAVLVLGAAGGTYFCRQKRKRRSGGGSETEYDSIASDDPAGSEVDQTENKDEFSLDDGNNLKNETEYLSVALGDRDDNIADQTENKYEFSLDDGNSLQHDTPGKSQKKETIPDSADSSKGKPRRRDKRYRCHTSFPKMSDISFGSQEDRQCDPKVSEMKS